MGLWFATHFNIYKMPMNEYTCEVCWRKCQKINGILQIQFYYNWLYPFRKHCVKEIELAKASGENRIKLLLINDNGFLSTMWMNWLKKRHATCKHMFAVFQKINGLHWNHFQSITETPHMLVSIWKVKYWIFAIKNFQSGKWRFRTSFLKRWLRHHHTFQHITQKVVVCRNIKIVYVHGTTQTNKFVDIPVQDEQTLDKLEKIIRVFWRPEIH